MDELERLTQLLRDANAGKGRYGMSEAEVDAEVARLSNGTYPTRSALSAAVRHLVTDPTAVAQRRQTAQAQAVTPDMVGSTGPLEVAASGATLGLTPILGGLIDAASGRPNQNPVDLFTQGREAAKARIDAFSSAHPTEAALEGLGGAVATMHPTTELLGPVIRPLERLLRVGKVAAGESPSAWHLIRQAAAAGAPAGAVYGATDAPTLGDVPRSAAQGFVLGGAVAGGLGAAAIPVTGLARLAGARAGAFFHPQAAADAQVLGQMGKVIDPAFAGTQLAAAEATHPGVAQLGDVYPTAYGEAMRGTPHTQSAEAALQQRSAGAGGRLADAAEMIGLPRVPGLPAADRAPNAVEASAAARRAFSQYSENVYVPIERANEAMNLAEHPRIATALQDPRIAPVMERVLGEPVASTDPMMGGAFKGKRWSQLTPQQQQAFTTAGQAPPPARVPFTALQEAENELLQMAERRPAGSRFTEPQLREAAKQLREAMRAEVRGPDGAVGGLARADAGWAAASEIYGPQSGTDKTGLLGLFAEGNAAVGGRPEAITQRLAQLEGKPAAQSAFRTGILDAVTSHLRGLREGVDPSRVATSTGDQALEPHLRAAFGDHQGIDQFLRHTETEKFFRTAAQQFSGGSPTAPRTTLRGILYPNEGANPFKRLLRQFSSDAVTVAPEALGQGYQSRFQARGPEAQSVLADIAAANEQLAARGPMMQRALRRAGVVAGGGGKTATAASEAAALWALLNGAQGVTRAVTGHTNDSGY